MLNSFLNVIELRQQKQCLVFLYPRASRSMLKATGAFMHCNMKKDTLAVGTTRVSGGESPKLYDSQTLE